MRMARLVDLKELGKKRRGHPKVWLRTRNVIWILTALMMAFSAVWLSTALRSNSKSKGGLPQGVPNPDFWWAVPRLEQTHLPVILPTWLPDQGSAKEIFNPQSAGGLPPINVVSWTNGAKYSAPGPGYSIGVGYVGVVAAVPFVNQKYVPTAVPDGLRSKFIESTDGRDSPPVGITVVHPTHPTRLIGMPVAIGHGMTAYLSLDESGGSIGDFVHASFYYHGDVVTVQYPNLAREDVVRIAASMVLVHLPNMLRVSYGKTQLTMEPLSTTGTSERKSSHTAFGYRYQLTKIKPITSLVIRPVPRRAPLPVKLPPIPYSALVTEMALPDQITTSLLGDKQWRHSLVASPGTVLVPSWLPSDQFMPFVAPEPVAWTTPSGYYLGIVPNFPLQSGMSWSYDNALKSRGLGRTHPVVIQGALTGVLSSSPARKVLQFRVAPYIVASVDLFMRSPMGTVPAHPTAFLLALARQVLQPEVLVQETGDRLQRPKGAASVRLSWGGGWMTRTPSTVQVTFTWHGHTYSVTTRGRLATRSTTLKIARDLTPIE